MSVSVGLEAKNQVNHALAMLFKLADQLSDARASLCLVREGHACAIVIPAISTVIVREPRGLGVRYTINHTGDEVLPAASIDAGRVVYDSSARNQTITQEQFVIWVNVISRAHALVR